MTVVYQDCSPLALIRLMGSLRLLMGGAGLGVPTRLGSKGLMIASARGSLVGIYMPRLLNGLKVSGGRGGKVGEYRGGEVGGDEERRVPKVFEDLWYRGAVDGRSGGREILV